MKMKVKMKKILLLVGPSGSGKSTIEKLLLAKGFNKVVSHTTRDMRNNEINGEDYFFVTKEQFLSEKDNFIEKIEFGGNYYGVHSSEILLKNGMDTVIVVEPNGAEQIMKWGVTNNVQVLIAYLDISKKSQIQRMISRGDDTVLIEKRIEIDDIQERAKNLNIDIKINTEKLSPIGVANTLLSFYNEVK